MPSLFSVCLGIRFNTSIWNSHLTNLVSQIKGWSVIDLKCLFELLLVLVLKDVMLQVYLLFHCYYSMKYWRNWWNIKFIPNQSRINPKQIDSIYARKTSSKGFWKGATSCYLVVDFSLVINKVFQTIIFPIKQVFLHEISLQYGKRGFMHCLVPSLRYVRHGKSYKRFRRVPSKPQTI